jgi:hypothetical protein
MQKMKLILILVLWLTSGNLLAQVGQQRVDARETAILDAERERHALQVLAKLTEKVIVSADGESTVRALQVLRDDRSASFVSMQRFRGKLGGRQGTFVLQGSEIVENGKIKAEWFVVPGSGTGDLSRLRGGAALKASLEKGPTQRWIIGSNEVATIKDSRSY